MTELSEDLSKLESYYKAINTVWLELKLPALKTTEAQKLARDIHEKFEGFKKWKEKEINNLK